MPEKILLINNGSKFLNHLEHICGESLKKVVEPGDIKVEDAEKYDAIILSGGYQHEVMGADDYYKKEIELVKRSVVPIVGVCLGFQLIAHAFGVPIHKMVRTENSTILIRPTEIGERVLGTGPFHVYEHHRWVVSKTPQDFHALAISRDGIESIMHESLPLVGFQFHPEMFVTKNDGRKILQTILKNLRQKIIVSSVTSKV
jgi:GMP synthase-like glutamine amidotransferase